MAFDYQTTHDAPTVFAKAPWQKRDLRKLKGLGGSANLSEMGSYKTSTGLWHIEQTVDPDAKTLICTTKTGKVTFHETLGMLLPDWPVTNLQVDSELPRKIAPGLYLAHYNLFTDKSALYATLRKQQFDMILLDEAHRIKNRNGQWSRNLVRLARRAEYRHVMTGRAFVNRPDELWNLLQFMWPTLYTSYWDWVKINCQVVNNGDYRHILGLKQERKKIVRESLRDISVRRTKAEVFPNLPEPQVHKVTVDLSPAQRRMYEQLRADKATQDAYDTWILTGTILPQLTRLRQVTAATPFVKREYADPKTGKRKIDIGLQEPSAKLDALIDILDDTSTKTVVFSQFVDVIHLAKIRMANAGITFIHMQQSDNDDVRAKKVRAFQRGPHQVFISTLDLGSESITLTAADKVIMIDRSWSPNANSQAIARVWRPGQQEHHPVEVIFIEAARTTDQRVEKKLAIKDQMFNEMFVTGGKW